MEKIKKIIVLFIICIISCKINFAENFKMGEMEYKFKNIQAQNLLLAEKNTGTILFGRNMEEKIYPASITKLLTAIIVLEHCSLKDIVIVSENAVKSVPSGYVNANLQVGEQLTVENLLYAMLIPSANDAANALAEFTGGNIESFASMMNTKAQELGCKNSNFTNPSGLHEENHYTTTYDLLLISKEAFSNSKVIEIISTTKYTLPQTNKYENMDRIFITTNYLINKNQKNFYTQYCIGGKTGYTDKAKNCVVEYVKKDNIELIVIVMGECSGIKGQKFGDVKEMAEYIFNNYNCITIANKLDVYENKRINNGTIKNINVLYNNSINILLKNGDTILKNVEKNVEYIKESAPIEKNEVIGKIKYKYNGEEYSTELIAEESIKENKTVSIIFKIFCLMLILYIIQNSKKSNKKIRKHGKNIKK